MTAADGPPIAPSLSAPSSPATTRRRWRPPPCSTPNRRPYPGRARSSPSRTGSTSPDSPARASPPNAPDACPTRTRLRSRARSRAGAIVIAKSQPGADHPIHGRCRHPIDLDRTPGASSSGEAALIGAGASNLRLGSDSGGSIRLPSAWCGVVGLKPSFEVVPNTGHYPRVDGRTVIGPMARRVADVAAVLAVIDRLRIVVVEDELSIASALEAIAHEHDGFDGSGLAERTLGNAFFYLGRIEDADRASRGFLRARSSARRIGADPEPSPAARVGTARRCGRQPVDRGIRANRGLVARGPQR